jgi:CrcB protein
MSNRPDPRQLAAIALGGAAGALARVALDRAFPPVAGQWPWVTFAINLSGSLLLALIVTRLQLRPPPSPHWRPLLATGLCGTYTTFATMQVEVLKMLDHDREVLAGGYLAASVAGGLAAIWLGTALVRRTHASRA